MTTSMNISLSDNLREFVKNRVKKDDYGNASAYMRTLIIQDKKRAAQEELENLLITGVNSPRSPMTKNDWSGLHDRVKARIEAKNNV